MHDIRDIRADLQDRANRVAEQISAAQGQFEKDLAQLKHEHLIIIEDLRSELECVNAVIGIEGRRIGSLVPAHKDETPETPVAEHKDDSQPPRVLQRLAKTTNLQQPISESLIRKVASVGVR